MSAAAAGPDISYLARRLAALGLILRGGFHPQVGDEVPGLPDGREAATLLVVGNAGPDLWPVFQASPEAADGRPDPMNRWTRRVLECLAEEYGAIAHYPFDGPPYRPFLRWAARAEDLSASPLGLLIHPDFGLWHAYRGALAFGERLELPERQARAAPCETCADKPCLSACPVGAFTGRDYRVGACATHVASAAGADCLELGCRARRACPVGQGAAYRPAQARFHMEAFLSNRPDPTARKGAA